MFCTSGTFSKSQARFAALEGLYPACMAAARLYHRQERDEFELHITFQFVVPKQETTHWIGVDRGIYNLAALSVLPP